MFFEERANYASLDALTATVDQSDFVNTRLPALFNVFFDDAWNFFWMKRVKIDEILDGNDDRLAKRRIR